MFRRGRLQRSLITLLALLMVTPQVLLRPCCCAQKHVAVSAAGEQLAGNQALPPCCLKRLTARKSAVASAVASSPARREHSLPGIHDSGRCDCRVANQLALINRTVFKPILAHYLEVWTAPRIDNVGGGQPTLSPVLTTAAHSAYADWGSESCARLCRWVV